MSRPPRPLGLPVLRTRAQLRDHFRAGAAQTDPALRFSPANITIHETTDPEVIVAEFEYRGSVDLRRPLRDRAASAQGSPHPAPPPRNRTRRSGRVACARVSRVAIAFRSRAS